MLRNVTSVPGQEGALSRGAEPWILPRRGGGPVQDRLGIRLTDREPITRKREVGETPVRPHQSSSFKFWIRDGRIQESVRSPGPQFNPPGVISVSCGAHFVTRKPSLILLEYQQFVQPWEVY